MTSPNEIVCAFQNRPFLCCPSLHPKLDYTGTNFIARPLGHAGRTGAAERMMTCLGGITADGEGTERRGKAKPWSKEGNDGCLHVTILDLC